MKNIATLLVIAFFTGFLGDACLQLATKLPDANLDWGLRGYFKQHGSAESLFIAGGMITFFYILYAYIFKLPLKWYYLAIYGIILDLIFRLSGIFPSLDGYYSHLNYFWSAVWGAIPMLIPYFVFTVIH